MKLRLLLCGVPLLVVAQETTPIVNPPEPQQQSSSLVATPVAATTKVVIHTALGDIHALIDIERAPITAANFLRYVDQKRFDGMPFYRAMVIGDTGDYGLIQAGLRGDSKKSLKPIPHESTIVTGLSHVSGALSMARTTPGSATSDFFIVVGNLPALDAQPQRSGDNLGYAVFGQVLPESMDVVKKILMQPKSPTAGEGVMKGQMLEPMIKVQSVRREP